MNTEELTAMLNDPEMKEIVDSFIVETKEIIDSLDVDLIELEQNPEDEELINKVFRSFHTIKGTSSFLNLTRLTTLTHRCEDILNKIRKKEALLTPDVMDLLLQGFDRIKELVVKIETERNEDVEIDDIVAQLTELYNNLGKAVPSENNDVKVVAESDKVNLQSIVTNDNIAETESKEDVDDMADVDIEETRQAEIKSTSMSLDAETRKEQVIKQTETKKTDNTIRVDVDRLDDLLNNVSELVLGRNRLAQINMDVSVEYEGTKLARELAETTKLIDMMTNELQQLVMKVRMVKIGKVFNKYPRLVRDLSKIADKKINLIIEGEDTELDKTLIEEINDPLVHLIRNSVDHGIEKEDVRIANGKDPVGTIKLSAVQEGNTVVITIEDDGKGIDPEVIKNKAISKGLITREKADELSKQEILNLIFLPGFSTAEVVTNISGRGVGMDVVKTNVTKLRGTIEIDSVPKRGTKISIRLPLTLAIISGLVVKVSNEQFVIPLSLVIEVIRVHKDNIYYINQKPNIKLRDEVIPIVSLREKVLKENGRSEINDYQYVVIVGIAEKHIGLEVDGLIGQKEIVIKSLGNLIGKIPGIAGSSILGDGSIILILDVAEVINQL
jgi:two-component system chemotaxis sensor kinase CheA